MSVALKRLVIIFVVGTTSLQISFAQVKAKLRSTRGAKKVLVAKTAIIPFSEPWQALPTKERLIEISTDFGVMIAKLYDSTPLHRDNFTRLIEQKFYDSLLFH